MIPNERLLGSASSSGPERRNENKNGPTDRPTDPRVFSITDWIRAIAAPRSNEPRISIRWLARGFMHALWPSAGAQSAVKVSGQRRPANSRTIRGWIKKKGGRISYSISLYFREISKNVSFPWSTCNNNWILEVESVVQCIFGWFFYLERVKWIHDF